MRTLKLTEETRNNLLEELLKRSPNQYGQYEMVVNEIIQAVREKRDEAVFEYTNKFDKWDCNRENLKVTQDEIDEAYAQIDDEFIACMKKSAENITAFHAKQLHNSWFDPKPDGTILGMKILPIEKAGVYVPGGKAAYPSSVLMNVLPAKVAGVKKIVMTTPAGADGKVNPGIATALLIQTVHFLCQKSVLFLMEDS